MYSFYLTLMILNAENDVEQEELDFFLKGQMSLEKAKQQKPFSWMMDQGWEDFVKLCSFEGEGKEGFDTLFDDVTRNEEAWRAWYDLDAPEAAEFPMGYNEKLTP